MKVGDRVYWSGPAGRGAWTSRDENGRRRKIPDPIVTHSGVVLAVLSEPHGALRVRRDDGRQKTIRRWRLEAERDRT